MSLIGDPDRPECGTIGSAPLLCGRDLVSNSGGCSSLLVVILKSKIEVLPDLSLPVRRFRHAETLANLPWVKIADNELGSGSMIPMRAGLHGCTNTEADLSVIECLLSMTYFTILATTNLASMTGQTLW